MTKRDHKAQLLRRARHYRRMARNALEASRTSLSGRNSLVVMAQEWYAMALQIEIMLPN